MEVVVFKRQRLRVRLAMAATVASHNDAVAVAMMAANFHGNRNNGTVTLVIAPSTAKNDAHGARGGID